MHLDAEIAQRFVDGELPAGGRTDVLDHLEDCDGCRRLVDESRRLSERTLGLIRSVEVPEPGITVADVRRAAMRRPPGWRRWAAAAVLTIAGATAAYAAYRAPLGSTAGGRGEAGSGGAPAVSPEPTAGGPSGIMVDAARSIHVQELGATGTLSVALYDGPGVAIRSTGAETTFDAEGDRVTVRWGAADTVKVAVEVPRSASTLAILVGERVVWTLENGRVTTVMEGGEEGLYRLTGGS